MFARIKDFYQKRKTTTKLRQSLNLLYSDKRFTTKGLLNEMNPKSDIETLEYYIIIEVASKLERPFNDDTIAQIHEQQIEPVKAYVDSSEMRDIMMELAEVKADRSLLTFNFYMNQLELALKYDKYSLDGMIVRKLKAKGSPLTETEEIQVIDQAKKIRKLDNIARESVKKLTDLANQME